MDRFQISDFTYELVGSELCFIKYKNRFVARIKHHNPEKQAKKFAEFLTKHIDVNEYYKQLEDGVLPSKIMQKKGFIL